MEFLDTDKPLLGRGRGIDRKLVGLLILEFFVEVPFALVICGSTVYNIDVQHFSEVQAGIIFALIGLAVGISAIGFSNFPSKYGIKVSLLYGNTLGLLTNILTYSFEDRYFQVFIIFILFIPSISLNFISLKLGIKHLTNSHNRSLAFSLSYTVFFLASGLSAALTDLMITEFGVTRQTFDYIFIINSASHLVSLLITCQISPIKDPEPTKNSQDSWKFIKEVLASKTFWKFFSLIALLSVVKSMFFHLNATLPTYMIRVLGPGAHFGYVLAGHQLVLIVCTPVLTVLTRFFTHYGLLVCGSFITALSAGVFVFGGNYWTVSGFAVAISVGEAIYAPRLIDYTLQVAPKGKEGIYLGVSNVPNFLSLLITGVSSGVLLGTVCLREESEGCSEIWFWIGGYSLFACFMLVVLRKVF